MYGKKAKGHGEQERNSISSKSGDKRAYVRGKATWTCVLLATGEKEANSESAGVVNFIKVQRQKTKALARLTLKKCTLYGLYWCSLSSLL